jgi:hypothetical protein
MPKEDMMKPARKKNPVITGTIVPGSRVRIRGTNCVSTPQGERGGKPLHLVIWTDLVEVRTGTRFGNEMFLLSSLFDRLAPWHSGDVIEFDARVVLKPTLTFSQRERVAQLPPAQAYRLLRPTKLVRISSAADEQSHEVASEIAFECPGSVSQTT